MERVIKKIPIPIAGLMLALAALGNLILSYGSVYRNIFGVISAGILILLIIKILTGFKTIVEKLNNPVIASVSPTFSMGLMILSTYIKPSLPSIAYGIWILGILIHCVLIVYFTKKHVLKFSIEKIFPSCFVVYVGIVVASVTAPAYNMIKLGQIIFWFGLISYLALLPIVTYRVFFIKRIKEPALPTIAIFAAPASLCLAGYMSSFIEKNMIIIVFLTCLSLIMTASVLMYMPKMLRIKFYPSYAAFTFPFVISAIAIKKVNGFLIKINQSIEVLNYIVKFEELIAVLIVIYVLIRYVSFIFVKEEVDNTIKN
ncbi:TDT family transporter [Paramaledivibacter caminithermalis]|jgi:exfoliative toxin A/B|uniref:Exfoliative toxin A/B n=1 Tax=Paramaledivibacter caminithermalis (strain DSM 15212 / CIP 107654 / DViRD3) TaxID=1121301 RepID=A0A1M6LE83_PARC5|nr:TDT family transporter [Paramaledivibacter caminithermalis]SHJ69395.1 exfoliative toxin A/B [Paramaledivibacter caminithermalis DSM 15212]